MPRFHNSGESSPAKVFGRDKGIVREAVSDLGAAIDSNGSMRLCQEGREGRGFLRFPINSSIAANQGPEKAKLRDEGIPFVDREVGLFLGSNRCQGKLRLEFPMMSGVAAADDDYLPPFFNIDHLARGGADPYHLAQQTGREILTMSEML